MLDKLPKLNKEDVFKRLPQFLMTALTASMINVTPANSATLVGQQELSTASKETTLALNNPNESTTSQPKFKTIYLNLGIEDGQFEVIVPADMSTDSYSLSVVSRIFQENNGNPVKISYIPQILPRTTLGDLADFSAPPVDQNLPNYITSKPVYEYLKFHNIDIKSTISELKSSKEIVDYINTLDIKEATKIRLIRSLEMAPFLSIWKDPKMNEQVLDSAKNAIFVSGFCEEKVRELGPEVGNKFCLKVYEDLKQIVYRSKFELVKELREMGLFSKTNLHKFYKTGENIGFRDIFEKLPTEDPEAVLRFVCAAIPPSSGIPVAPNPKQTTPTKTYPNFGNGFQVVTGQQATNLIPDIVNNTNDQNSGGNNGKIYGRKLGIMELKNSPTDKLPKVETPELSTSNIGFRPEPEVKINEVTTDINIPPYRVPFVTTLPPVTPIPEISPTTPIPEIPQIYITPTVPPFVPTPTPTVSPTPTPTVPPFIPTPTPTVSPTPTSIPDRGTPGGILAATALAGLALKRRK